jgi:hypothetical protein
MKPIEILRRYKGDISLIDDCVLEIIHGFGKPITVQKIVLACGNEGVASPATVHKAISNLMRSNLVRTATEKTGMDNRKHWIEPTSAGRRRIVSS